MLEYLIKRIFIFIPTLFVISLITFSLSVMVPGDPVEQILNKGGQGDFANLSSLVAEKAYTEKRKELGLDLPVFYISLSNSAVPKDLYKIPKKNNQALLKEFIKKYSNWPEVKEYFDQSQSYFRALYAYNADSITVETVIQLKDAAFGIISESDDKIVQQRFKETENLLALFPNEFLALNQKFIATKVAYSNMQTNTSRWKSLIPTVHFYGTQNQYHQWATKFLKGDFGTSYKDNRPVSDSLLEASGKTIIISLISIFLTYLIAVPLGVFSAYRKGTTSEQVTTTILFMLYSLPSFWIATLLINFLGGGDYLGWFPSYGLGDQEVEAATGFWEKLSIRIHHLVLPLICWTYGSLAFMARQMRGGMINVLNQDYIRTARAKGLEEKTVVWKHAFRNSLLPIITLFASVFPLMLSGSIVIEMIFNIPGMGRLAVEAIIARNWPILYAVVMVSAVLTLVGYLIADILYAVVDPRITYGDSKK